MGNLLGTPAGDAPHTADSYRALASTHAGHAKDCGARSQAAYHAGRHADAKQLSAESKRHWALVQKYNGLAAAQAFEANNKARSPAEVDLHGLHVKEAIRYATDAIDQAKRDGRRSLTLIVGRGRHSQDGVARIKPAIQDLIRKHNLRCTPGVPNAGCLLVEFTSPDQSGWFADGSLCTIM